MVPVQDEIDQVVHKINQEKRQDQELQLLSEMNALMIYQHRVQFKTAVFYQYKWKYCHPACRELRKYQKQRLQKVSMFIFGKGGSRKASGLRL